MNQGLFLNRCPSSNPLLLNAKSMVSKGKYGPAYFFVGIFLLISFLLRLALYIRMFDMADSSLFQLLAVFMTGLFYDFGTALYFVLPLVMYLALEPRVFARTSLRRYVLAMMFSSWVFLLLFSSVSEWIFWDEFGVRFNFIAVDYLVYTQEVVGNIMESYPVAFIMAAIFAISLMMVVLSVRSGVLSLQVAESTPRQRMAALFIFLVLPVLFTAFIDRASLRSSDNEYNNELAMNGIFSFFSAYRNNVLEYGRFYRLIPEAEAYSRVKFHMSEDNVHFNPDHPLAMDHHVDAVNSERRLNIVVVMVESLSAEFLGFHDNHLGLTPNLDSIAADGLVFDNFYATGTRTVRGIEAVMLSTPPVPGQSVVRRPFVHDYHSVVPVLTSHGYDLSFIYGGHAYFDNMGEFFRRLGFSVIDKSTMDDDEIHFSNIWGVADEDTFDAALNDAGRAYRSGSPFFQFVLTTSNHRPFTYPEGRIDIPSHTGRYGAVKYTDYAIGRFIEMASKEPWFAETVFVIVADHCAGSAGKTKLPANEFHIPLIIYSPDNVNPDRVGTLSGQIDVMPTVFGLLGFNYDADFYGRNILEISPGQGSAFIANYEHLGYLRNDLVYILSPMGEASSYMLGQDKVVPLEGTDSILEEAIAYYETASRRFELTP